MQPSDSNVALFNVCAKRVRRPVKYAIECMGFFRTISIGRVDLTVRLGTTRM